MLVTLGVLIVFRVIYLLMVRDMDDIYGWRKIAVKAIRNYKNAAGKISDH